MTYIKSLRELGLEHLTTAEPCQAFHLFFGLLKTDPTNADILMLLGDWYLAGGDGAAADVFYRRVTQLQPDSPQLKTRQQLATAPALQREKWLTDSDLPLGAEGANFFLDSLKESKKPDRQIEETLTLLDSIMRDPNPATAVQKHLPQILDQLPTLIALNATQAQREGKVELANVLQNLAQRLAD
ncbi:MAG: hypothetical protein HZC38_19545 [Chloroflexi bacterium]|nr:hypothetical protein [Chloroflexota bacterium]